MLTSSQLQTLKTDLAANTNTVTIGGSPVAINAITGALRTADNADAVARWYNGLASPEFVLWKFSVSLEDVGDAINGQNVADMTAANADRLSVFFNIMPGGVKPFRADHRAFFNDVFSGAAGTETRATLDGTNPQNPGLWRRIANRIEKLLSTGTGSYADPATIPDESITIVYQDVQAAWNLP